MSIQTDINTWRAMLDTAIDEAMEGPVTEAAKDAMLEAEMTDVYSYAPDFFSRRYGSDGIADKANMKDEYSSATKTLEITNEAEWQQLYGGTAPSARLAEAIESGENMHGAGSRPFFEHAESILDDQGMAERELVAVLRNAGFTVIT